jgi:hypothetical protein
MDNKFALLIKKAEEAHRRGEIDLTFYGKLNSLILDVMLETTKLDEEKSSKTKLEK